MKRDKLVEATAYWNDYTIRKYHAFLNMKCVSGTTTLTYGGTTYTYSNGLVPTGWTTYRRSYGRIASSSNHYLTELLTTNLHQSNAGIYMTYSTHVFKDQTYNEDGLYNRVSNSTTSVQINGGQNGIIIQSTANSTDANAYINGGSAYTFVSSNWNPTGAIYEVYPIDQFDTENSCNSQVIQTIDPTPVRFNLTKYTYWQTVIQNADMKAYFNVSLNQYLCPVINYTILDK